MWWSYLDSTTDNWTIVVLIIQNLFLIAITINWLMKYEKKIKAVEEKTNLREVK